MAHPAGRTRSVNVPICFFPAGFWTPKRAKRFAAFRNRRGVAGEPKARAQPRSDRRAEHAGKRRRTVT